MPMSNRNRCDTPATPPLPGTLPSARLARYVTHQLGAFFPDGQMGHGAALRGALPRALARLERCLAGLAVACFARDGAPFFNHLNSEQYAMFLYLLAHECGRGGEKLRTTATKLYLLNKALHGLEAYYEIELPEIFYLAHPVGTVLGRAQYGNRLLVMQGCTVGNVGGKYPVLGERVVLCAHSVVLGDCRLGDGVCVGAGSLLINVSVPTGRTAVGRGKEMALLARPACLWQNYFRTDK